MWKQQNNAALLRPLLLTRSYVFINDGLRTICEVTELGFPHS